MYLRISEEEILKREGEINLTSNWSWLRSLEHDITMNQNYWEGFTNWDDMKRLDELPTNKEALSHVNLGNQDYYKVYEKGKYVSKT